MHMVRATKDKREAGRGRLKKLASVASRFKAWRPAVEVLTAVRSHSTIFPQFDRATRVGGYPLQRFGVTHGPSAHGKTQFVIGVGCSFLETDDYFAYVDAEYTTAQDWVQKLMGKYATHPRFLALRPHSFEKTVLAVREVLEGVAADRDAGKEPPERTVFVAVDSIRKLVPERLMEKLAKGEGGVDGASGRAAQYRAALNAQWLDELTPLLYHTNTSMMFVSRETEDQEGLVKVGGGVGLIYDASLVCRVQRASWVKEGSGDDARVIGEQHRVRITKSKVAGKEGKFTDSYFHTSNGALFPEGFDRARDVVQLAGQLGLIDINGSWYSWEGRRLGQGINKTLANLRADQDTLTRLENKVRSMEVTDGEEGIDDTEEAAGEDEATEG